MSEQSAQQNRSRTVTVARPRLISAIVRELDRRQLTARDLQPIYPINRQHLYELRAENVGRMRSQCGIDRLLGLAEALEIDVQAAMFPEREAA